MRRSVGLAGGVSVGSSCGGAGGGRLPALEHLPDPDDLLEASDRLRGRRLLMRATFLLHRSAARRFTWSPPLTQSCRIIVWN
jgi:hypothetical protein